jgi:hypothetical protein
LEQPARATADRATVMLKTVEKNAIRRRDINVSCDENSTYIFVEFLGLAVTANNGRSNARSRGLSRYRR